MLRGAETILLAVRKEHRPAVSKRPAACQLAGSRSSVRGREALPPTPVLVPLRLMSESSCSNATMRATPGRHALPHAIQITGSRSVTVVDALWSVTRSPYPPVQDICAPTLAYTSAEITGLTETSPAADQVCVQMAGLVAEAERVVSRALPERLSDLFGPHRQCVAMRIARHRGLMQRRT